MSRIDACRRRIMRLLRMPPPWFWLSEERLWRRFGVAPLWRLPLELIQQLHWWLLAPIVRRQGRRNGMAPLPRSLTLRACWLNSYRPAEVAWWWSLGVRQWSQLAQQTPESLVGSIHARRRRLWPDQCRPALRQLADKAALLTATPEPWRAPFMLLQPLHSRDSTDPIGDLPSDPAIPGWWWQALSGEGVVLKPQFGHACRDVIRFHWSGSALEQQALFGTLPGDTPSYQAAVPPVPQQLLAHWHRLLGSDEPALAAPYQDHSPDLPATFPSVVVRVITARPSPEGVVVVQQAWLEVPLGGDVVVFIRPNGDRLPHPGAPLTAAQQQNLEQWEQRLSDGTTTCVGACLTAAIEMHRRLPPIDRVAWDWIPASPQPVLLEGNGCFGLLVPQLLAHMAIRHGSGGDAWNPWTPIRRSPAGPEGK